MLAGGLGLRWGEAIAIKETDLTWLKRPAQVMVQRRIIDISGRLVERDGTKGDRPGRTVFAPDWVIDRLGALLEDHPPIDSGHIAHGPNGGLMRKDSYRKRHFAPAKAAVGVDPAFRFHDLRHTHAAHLIRQGVHPKVIQDRLGHANITTTLMTYGHIMDGLDEGVAGLMDAMAADAGGSDAEVIPLRDAL